MKKQEACIKCQLCCKVLHFPVSTGAVPFYEARGIKVIDDPEVGLFIEVPQSCHHLTKNGCSIYDKRPVACRVFDGSKDKLIKDRCLWGLLT
jgi:Fe-S-cluster containining protein